jgi:hypothetical protein
MIKRNAPILATAGFAILLAACSASVGVNDDSSGTQSTTSTEGKSSYAENGVALDYPADWEALDQAGATTSTGANELWTQGFGPDASGSNVVIVSAYQLKLDVGDVPAEQLKTEIEATLDQLAQQAGGSRVGELEEASLGSLTGFQATINAESAEGAPVQSRVVFGFDRDTEYFLNCQYEPSAKVQILGGCDTMQQTFAVATA